MTDPKALNPERWLEEHGDVLFRYALARLGNVEAAEDLVQETLIAALEGREAYAGRASERNWLMGILKHKVHDAHRRRILERTYQRSLHHDPPSGTTGRDRRGEWHQQPWDPERQVLLRELHQLLGEHLADLPERQARAFALSLIDGGPRAARGCGLSSTRFRPGSAVLC